MLMVWNQIETPLSTRVDLGPALQWAGVSPGQRLSISSAIAGPSETPGAEPSWALGNSVRVVMKSNGAVPMQLKLPAMAFEYYLIRASELDMTKRQSSILPAKTLPLTRVLSARLRRTT